MSRCQVRNVTGEGDTGVTEGMDTPGVPASSEPPCVLVVDDDSYIRDVVAQLLESEGYRVEEATNGVEALTIVNDATRRPDLILLDLMMPVMDGWEFARRMHELHP